MTQASRDRTEYVEISGTAADRAAFNNPKQAMEWYETDTTARYKYLSGSWVLVTASSGAAPGYGGGGGGGGGAVTLADGADITQGAKADAAATTDTGTFSLVALFKRLLTKTNPQAAPYTAQQRATASAVALPSQALLNGLVVTASPKNVGDIMVGGASVTGANDGLGIGEALQPGVARAFACSNANQVYIIWATGNTTATDFVTVSGN